MALRTDKDGRRIGKRALKEGEIVVEMDMYELDLGWSPLRENMPGYMSEEISGTVREVGAEIMSWQATRNISSKVTITQKEWFIWNNGELPEKYLEAVKNFLKQLKITLPKIK